MNLKIWWNSLWKTKRWKSCWFCRYRKSPYFEGFECGKKKVWVDGRGIIGSLLGVKSWKKYEMDALKVRDYYCKEFKWHDDVPISRRVKN